MLVFMLRVLILVSFVDGYLGWPIVVSSMAAFQFLVGFASFVLVATTVLLMISTRAPWRVVTAASWATSSPVT